MIHLVEKQPQGLVVERHPGQVLVPDALAEHRAAVERYVRVAVRPDHVLHHQRLPLDVLHEVLDVLAHQVAENLKKQAGHAEIEIEVEVEVRTRACMHSGHEKKKKRPQRTTHGLKEA